MMKAIEITRAIQRLRPNAEFSFTGDDYSTIKWDKLDGEAPSLLELEEANKQNKADQIQFEKNLAAKRAAAEAKLSALGLDADDLKALGL